MAQSRTELNHQGCMNTSDTSFKRYIAGDEMIGLSCNECLSEWVLHGYVTEEHKGAETIELPSGTFHLINKPFVLESNFAPRPDPVKITDLNDLAEYLTPGDHIMYNWALRFNHHAIVSEVGTSDTGGPDWVTLIHWQGRRNPAVVVGKGGVVQETIADMTKKAKFIERCDYNDGSIPEDRKVLTLARAKSWVGETGYNIATKNCEHFAVFCKIGRYWSFQGERLLTRVLSVCNSAMAASYGPMAADITGDIIEVGIAGATGVGMAALQGVGLGLVVMIHGICVYIRCEHLYNKFENGGMSADEYIGRKWHTVCKGLESIFFQGVFPAAVVTLALLTPGVGAIASILLGVAVAGTLSMPWGYDGERTIGCHLANALVSIQYRDKSVEDIKELSAGDQIVVPMWVLHPRCHMIVTSVDYEERKIGVIRFTKKRGVVEEVIKFHMPMRKMLPDCTFPFEEVIARARGSTVTSNDYSILTFNCKHFAFLCKTGTRPALS